MRDHDGFIKFIDFHQAFTCCLIRRRASQETTYMGVIDDLKAAAALFATGNDIAVDGDVDLYFGGDMAAWERFANSLLIRYYVRISEKKTEAKAAVDALLSLSCLDITGHWILIKLQLRRKCL